MFPSLKYKDRIAKRAGIFKLTLLLLDDAVFQRVIKGLAGQNDFLLSQSGGRTPLGLTASYC
jgi:hypothetical protein